MDQQGTWIQSIQHYQLQGVPILHAYDICKLLLGDFITHVTQKLTLLQINGKMEMDTTTMTHPLYMGWYYNNTNYKQLIFLWIDSK